MDNFLLIWQIVPDNCRFYKVPVMHWPMFEHVAGCIHGTEISEEISDQLDEVNNLLPKLEKVNANELHKFKFVKAVTCGWMLKA